MNNMPDLRSNFQIHHIFPVELYVQFGMLLSSAGFLREATGNKVGLLVEQNVIDVLRDIPITDYGDSLLFPFFLPRFCGSICLSIFFSNPIIHSRSPTGRPVVSAKRRALKASISSYGSARYFRKFPKRSSTGFVLKLRSSSFFRCPFTLDHSQS